MSIIPRNAAITILITITIAVWRMVSSRDGQVTFLSSILDSLKKVVSFANIMQTLLALPYFKRPAGLNFLSLWCIIWVVKFFQGRQRVVRILPVLLIAALGLVAFAVKMIFAPLYGSEEWISFHISFICAVATAGFLIWSWFFPSHPGCNLFFNPQGSCFGRSVGRVEIKEARCSDGKYISTGRRYFCRVHDSRHIWMHDWFREHQIQIVPNTIKKLRFIDENPWEGF